MTVDFDSERSRTADESRPEETVPALSRRELRLQAERDKVAAIARERERERIREAALKRAEEIRREKEALRAREADEERFLEHINNSQQIPTLPRDAITFPPVIGAAPSEKPVAVMESATNITTTDAPSGLSYAERGHEGALRRKRAEAKRLAKESARASRSPKPAPTGSRASRIRNGAGRAFVVMVVSGLLAVLALPATGFNLENQGWASDKKTEDQSVKLTGTGSEAEQVALGEYAVTTYADLLKLTYGASQGFKYSVTNSGKIRWPFPVVVPISSGYGGRVAPCLGCSSYHEGLDFNPTEGTPFYAVAAGEVTEVHDDAWGLGKWVVIHHEVGKLKFDSLYAHMIRDSTGVKVGQKVEAGDYIGRIGNSGTSTGAHLHFEIHVDGTPVDPFEWLKKHTKGN